MTCVLKAQNLKKVYGSKFNLYTALDDISLEIDRGEFVGIMGPSGAGKTTLLNIISTIDKPTSGRVSIDGDEIVSLNEKKLSDFRKNKLGFIFQDFNLLDTLTVRENIVLPLALSKVNHKTINQKVDQISASLGINDLLNKYPYEISGGEKQRTAAARAIINTPKLILTKNITHNSYLITHNLFQS